jgi:predicted anti-sigma-YlaC factor YlaD
MRIEACNREDDLLVALSRGYVAAELEEHVGTCQACSELRTVAGALLDERVEAMREATVPASGTMWWRMRIRQRQDAEARARRSLLVGQAMTLTVAIVLAVVFFGSDLAIVVRNGFAAVRVSTPLLLAALTWVFLAPIAGWVAIRQK